MITVAVGIPKKRKRVSSQIFKYMALQTYQDQTSPHDYITKSHSFEKMICEVYKWNYRAKLLVVAQIQNC